MPKEKPRSNDLDIPKQSPKKKVQNIYTHLQIGPLVFHISNNFESEKKTC